MQHLGQVVSSMKREHRRIAKAPWGSSIGSSSYRAWQELYRVCPCKAYIERCCPVRSEFALKGERTNTEIIMIMVLLRHGPPIFYSVMEQLYSIRKLKAGIIKPGGTLPPRIVSRLSECPLITAGRAFSVCATHEHS